MANADFRNNATPTQDLYSAAELYDALEELQADCVEAAYFIASRMRQSQAQGGTPAQEVDAQVAKYEEALWLVKMASMGVKVASEVTQREKTS